MMVTEMHQLEHIRTNNEPRLRPMDNQVQLMSCLMPMRKQEHLHSAPMTTSLVPTQRPSQKVRKHSGGTSENTNQLGGKFVNG